ncbi:hypothetical protein LU604_07880 [Erwinia tracheiphila]|uniref:hypothetical protein n=1 Tax=Erwinia tracheiphila TaxID=65700 RepID=UPI001F45EFE8|nr:hypothetical protein [Erwinia tracheiphila]UIA84823.1 hypothetical protein LU604_07880 [Erwinia tracheiphila]UIA93418.1 hypothetical protein LU632_07840 [Erwinia tracheiphila]
MSVINGKSAAIFPNTEIISGSITRPNWEEGKKFSSRLLSCLRMVSNTFLKLIPCVRRQGSHEVQKSQWVQESQLETSHNKKAELINLYKNFILIKIKDNDVNGIFRVSPHSGKIKELESDKLNPEETQSFLQSDKGGAIVAAYMLLKELKRINGNLDMKATAEVLNSGGNLHDIIVKVWKTESKSENKCGKDEFQLILTALSEIYVALRETPREEAPPYALAMAVAPNLFPPRFSSEPGNAVVSGEQFKTIMDEGIAITERMMAQSKNNGSVKKTVQHEENKKSEPTSTFLDKFKTVAINKNDLFDTSKDQGVKFSHENKESTAQPDSAPSFREIRPNKSQLYAIVAGGVNKEKLSMPGGYIESLVFCMLQHFNKANGDNTGVSKKDFDYYLNRVQGNKSRGNGFVYATESIGMSLTELLNNKLLENNKSQMRVIVNRHIPAPLSHIKHQEKFGPNDGTEVHIYQNGNEFIAGD